MLLKTGILLPGVFTSPGMQTQTRRPAAPEAAAVSLCFPPEQARGLRRQGG